jgi:sugar phosphate isomerase/epimerase
MPRVVLGADTLCWHLRLEQRELSLEEAFAEAAEAGAAFVQLSLHHARDVATGDLPALARRAGEMGLGLLASGDPLAGAHRGEPVATATARVEEWIERAAALGSPILRVASGFYRADLADRPEAIEAERRWTVEALGGALGSARAAGIRLAIENHSDFTVSEY